MADALDRNQLFSFARSHRDEYETLLKRFVETPTVSCDPAYAEDIRAGLDLTVETLRDLAAKSTSTKRAKAIHLCMGFRFK